ncbi:hypothetical protein K1T71_000432 [Dendrolimus kikuchii]|uniref:Uncharacterized protein n=1 Tax=Dendrolimus kikuchii TaxID=765133 RepID=A0ACC1DJ52_9NEOP|nr:hypothetical protein K1T71_000432 [Dendrolimus kikuchii]
MYQRNSYLHASYYEYDHGCSIIPQKDVLNIDIPGGSFVDSLRRWWHNLFLLSCTDERCPRYYTSTHTMRMERVKQFRRYRNRIHPLSKFRNAWDCIMLCVFTLNIINFHHNSSPTIGQLFRPFYYSAVINDLLIMVDLVVNMKTGYIDQESRKIVLQFKKRLVNYCSTKLFLHFASAIPLQMLMFLRLGKKVYSDKCKLNIFIYSLRILNIFRLYRLFEASTYLNREKSSVKVTHFFKFFRICLVSFLSMLVYNSFHETVSFLSIEINEAVDLTTFHGTLIKSKYVKGNITRDVQFLMLELSKTWKSLLLFSFGFNLLGHHLDRLAFIGSYCIATIFHLWCLIECYAFISQTNYTEDKKLLLKGVSLAMVHCKQLPDTMCTKISKYFNYTMSWVREVEKKNGLYNNLPYSVKKEIMLTCYRRHIMRVPYFSQWPNDIIDDLVMLLKQNIYLTNDVVVESGIQGDGLVIVECGMMAVYSTEGIETGHLIDGDYFGELSLVTDKELQMSNVVAITPCKVLILNKVVFRKYMRDHAHLFFEMKQILQDKYYTAIRSGASLRTKIERAE